MGINKKLLKIQTKMPGKIGKYEVIRTLGSGASCKVKLGLDTETNERVAIKIMKDNMDPKEKVLVDNEIEKLSKLNHRNIIN